MSRRGKGEKRRRGEEEVAQPQSALQVYALAAMGLALLLMGLGGGMLYDNVPPTPDAAVVFDLLATPLALILTAAALAISSALNRQDTKAQSEKGEGAKGRRGEGEILAPHSLPEPRAESLHSPHSTLHFTLSAFLLFLACCALSLFRARYAYHGVNMLAIFVASVIAGMLIVQCARSQGMAAGMAMALVGVATVVAVIGLNEYVRNWRDGNPNWRVFASFVNPNFLAAYLLLALPITAALFLAVRDRNLTLLTGLALLMQAGCLVLTQSRMGLAALAVSLVVFAALLVRSGALVGAARRRAMIIGGVLLAAAMVGAKPVLTRLRAVGGESYSAQFRVLTWQGTGAMARANPLLGTGLATFETAYPPYAVVGYTQHAHNSFIQLAGEIGYPGLLFLLLGLGGTLFAGVRVVWSREAAIQGSPPTAEEEKGRRGEEETFAPYPSPRLLLAGALASIVGALAHNLFDSDLYIPANALTLGAVCGLTFSLAELPSPWKEEGLGVRVEATSERDRPLTAIGLLRSLRIVVAVFLTIHALRIAGGRLEAYNAAEALVAGTGAVALEGYRSAIALDGGNVEYRLQLAAILAASNQLEKAREVLDDAVKVAPIGKVYYRYGKLLSRMGKPEEALRMHERAKELEPNNLQNLLALADVYKAAGKPEEATRIYRRMVSLYRSPVGQVRPVPELVDWEYGMAFLGLAEQALARGNRSAAEPDLREGAGILGRFWETRSQGVAQIRVNPEVRRNTTLRYDWALEQWAKALREVGRVEEAAKIEERRARLHTEMEKETGNLPP